MSAAKAIYAHTNYIQLQMTYANIVYSDTTKMDEKLIDLMNIESKNNVLYHFVRIFGGVSL